MNLLICPSCGDLNPEPRLAADGRALICPTCRHRAPFRRLPLFAVTGPSGAGKSTVGALLVQRLGDRAVVLDQDLIWLDGLRDPADDFATFRRTWLRLAAAIQQSGRPVVLCGTVVPVQFERHPERVLFSAVHYLALVVEPARLRERLLGRPSWREWSEPRIAEMLEFNDWMRREASTTQPPMELVDTTRPAAEEVADHVAAWVSRGLGASSD